MKDINAKFDRLSVSYEVLVRSNKELSIANKNLAEIVGIIASSSARSASSRAPESRPYFPIQSTPAAKNHQFLNLASLPSAPQTNSIRQSTPGPPDHTYDHLQRCLNSVQELAKTISCAMDVWRGQEKAGNTDIHGSHARLMLELGKLPKELECKDCSGRVSWSEFDLTKSASAGLGTCICAGQASIERWLDQYHIPEHPYGFASSADVSMLVEASTAAPSSASSGFLPPRTATSNDMTTFTYGGFDEPKTQTCTFTPLWLTHELCYCCNLRRRSIVESGPRYPSTRLDRPKSLSESFTSEQTDAATSSAVQKNSSRQAVDSDLVAVHGLLKRWLGNDATAIF